MLTVIQYTTSCVYEQFATNISRYTSHNKLHHQSAEHFELITMYVRKNQLTHLIFNGF
jgi:hypothetical protein